MKTITTFLSFLATISFTSAQVMEQMELKDGSIQYYFSLDKFQKSLNLPIEVSHLGGDITKLKANTKSKLGGTVVFIDQNDKVLYEQKMDSTLTFEFNTDKKTATIECNVKGYSPYVKNLELERLSILVLKLQPEPQDAIYVINSQTTFSEMKLEEIMQCVNRQVESHPGKNDFSTCEKIYKAKIAVQ